MQYMRLNLGILHMYIHAENAHTYLTQGECRGLKAISYTEQRKLTGGEAMQAGWHWAGLATGAMAVETLLAAPAAALCRRRALPPPRYVPRHS